ncbi:MAG: 5'-methylthioadenosine/S-adenosylhomocysteine nucleosidase [Oscillospiraceae bacterium]|nr:5'-methylthioadenosine/S-adenosylhomocysteine nucleosidase [Oscillospiraceae bacterium]
MEIEIKVLLENLSNREEISIGGGNFYKGFIHDKPVIISRTGIGIVPAAMATTIGIIEFEPSAVINQGIAGAHRLDIHIGDIVIGEKVINANSFETPFRAEGEGSQPLDWEASDWVERNEAYGDKRLIELAKDVKYSKGKVYFGPIGSGDFWNREADRINWLHEKYGTLCEEMEGFGTYAVCNKFDVPCLGIRIISNNEIAGREYEKNMGLVIQKFTMGVMKKM